MSLLWFDDSLVSESSVRPFRIILLMLPRVQVLQLGGLSRGWWALSREECQWQSEGGLRNFLRRNAPMSLLENVVLPLDPFDHSVDAESDPSLVLPYVGRVDLDRWWRNEENDECSSFAATRFVNLSPVDLKALSEAYRQRNSTGLISVAKRIDAACASFGGEAFFVKLSSRSPKDAVLETPRFREALLARLDDEKEQSLNSDGIAFYLACQEAMGMRSGLEAVELLSLSTRVFHDVRRHCSASPSAELQLVVRQFHAIHPRDEWRAFVVRGRITAVSQYVDCVYFKGLEEEIPKVRARLALFENRILPLLASRLPPAFVCDLWLPSGEEYVRVIEVNPFYHKTGACLFDWKRDRGVLLAGRCVVRVVNEPDETVLRAEFGDLRSSLESESQKTSEIDKKPCMLM